MAGFYHDFTATRTTEPHFESLLAQLRMLDATAGITEHTIGTQTYKLKKNSDWTPAQITAAQNALNTAPASSPVLNFTDTSRQKDVLAMCALIARARGIAAWNAKTLAEKKADTLAEADVWVNIREFIETNL